MRLSVSQKVTEAVIFNVVTIVIWSPAIWAMGMSLDTIPLDRGVNLALSTTAVFLQERLARPRTPLPNRTWREQVLRPILGSGELFALQALIYWPVMSMLSAADADIVLGLANLLGGSVALWIWQEKFRWIALIWEYGRRRVLPWLAGLHSFLRQVGRFARRG